ncbi:MAG: zinc-dependent dehydrogenase [Thermoplasmata archaeon]
MRVAIYYSNDDVRIEEMPIPSIGSKEMLVKVHASGICGSDVMEWYRIKKAPRVLGHEITGEIVKVGDDIEGYDIGDRVFVSHHVPCGSCKYCEDDHTSVCDTLRSTNFDPGGFAEYLRVPEINVEKGVYELPTNMNYSEGVFVEPLACVVRGQKFLDVGSDDTVLVIGSGLSGMLHIKLALAKGVKRVIATDISQYRLETAKRIGAKTALKAEDVTPPNIRKANDGCLPERVIVSVGVSSAMEQAFKTVDKGGRILLFAPLKPDEMLPMPVWDLWKDEVSITTSYAASGDDIQEAIELISSGKVKVDDMISHKLPLEEAQEGFKLTAKGEDSLKVIIKPHM